MYMTTVLNVVYRKIVSDFGLWDQLRVDKGREWALMFVNNMLSQYRNDTTKSPHLQTASTKVG